jgi:hypothetical protein
MTYKRFSPDADTFLVIRFKPVFGKTEFFNSHGCPQQLLRVDATKVSACNLLDRDLALRLRGQKREANSNVVEMLKNAVGAL